MDKVLALLTKVPAVLSLARGREPRGAVAIALLVATNALPVIGIAFFGWDPAYVLVLYWAESVVIGLFNLLMMIASGSFAAIQSRRSVDFSTTFLLSGFFLVHYGLFAAVQGFFIGLLFMPGHEPFLGVLLAPGGYLPALITVFASHLFSFVGYFVSQGWYKHHRPEELLFRPYPRVFIMQVTIIGGAFLMNATGWRLGYIIVWLTAKTVVDLLAAGRTLDYLGAPVGRAKAPS